MTTTAEPRTSAPAVPVPAAPPAASKASVTTPTTPSPAPEASGTAPAQVDPELLADSRTVRLLGIVALLGGAVLAGIGFSGSYSALVTLGSDHGLGHFAHVFPIGVDVGIVVLLVLDLYLIHRRTPWPVLRFLAHLFTGATIVFNAAAADGPITADPIGAAMHGIIPLMFIASVEAGRRLYMHSMRLAEGHEPRGIPIVRWLYSPFSSIAMHRRMMLWDVPYSQARRLEQQRIAYRVWLDRKYAGKGGWRKAPSDERLPFKMARYGYSVGDALALPQQAEEEAQIRSEQAAEQALAAKIRADDRASRATVAALENKGNVEVAHHRVTARTGTAEAQARAAQAEADALATAKSRAAIVSADAIKAEETAEAERRAAGVAKDAAEVRRAAAEADKDAAEAEYAAAQKRADAEVELSREAEARARTETAVAAEEKARHEAAEARRAAAEAELRAREAEDLAKLKPSERGARQVARMLLAAGGGSESVDLLTIADALGVSQSTASERRKDAVELIAQGYRP
ncbi:DUF2637 domain-containing protein [Streptomyces sp. NPDC054863]